jgi:hypothetical protein
MRTWWTILAVAGSVGCGSAAVTGDEAPEGALPARTTSAALSPQERAREATMAYQDELQARLDGFLPMGGCREGSQGAEGVLYLNHARMDDVVDAERPEGLLYIPEPGGMRLVGVVYFRVVLRGGMPVTGSSVPENIDAAPVLLGEPMDGPTTVGDGEGRWHYRLTAWLWSDNPSGTFARYNPTLRCGG